MTSREAGMVDLLTATVLVELAIERGVGLAFVGHRIVRDVREQFVDRVSVGDGEEVSRVSAEYAREHMQLAHSTADGRDAPRCPLRDDA